MKQIVIKVLFLILPLSANADRLSNSGVVVLKESVSVSAVGEKRHIGGDDGIQVLKIRVCLAAVEISSDGSGKAVHEIQSGPDTMMMAKVYKYGNRDYWPNETASILPGHDACLTWERAIVLSTDHKVHEYSLDISIDVLAHGLPGLSGSIFQEGQFKVLLKIDERKKNPILLLWPKRKKQVGYDKPLFPMI